MKRTAFYTGFLCLIIFTFSCDDEVRNIAGGGVSVEPEVPQVTEVIPFDINQDGFDLLEKMQGHWTGTNRVIADDFDWFAFDYRPISPSHVHGIFEGGSIGNLFTSFFVTDYKNTRTIMARNGGLLNGIYRTSYFVLDSVNNGVDGKYYRLVDAKGGIGVMFMELKFNGDSLYFNAYTSGLGTDVLPTRHMTFKGVKGNSDLSETAALNVGFPQNLPAWDFSNGFNESFLYVNPGNNEAKSATFLAQTTQNSDIFSLAEEAGDPFKIGDIPYLSLLRVNIVKNSLIEDKYQFLYLTKESLTDELGYLKLEAFNSVLYFPELLGSENQFLFTYLHPGDYYVTVIADANDDGFISEGDITHVSKKITITPEGEHQITLDNITIVN